MANHNTAPQLKTAIAFGCTLFAVSALAQQRAIPTESFYGHDAVAHEAIVKFKSGAPSITADFSRAVDLQSSRLVGDGRFTIIHSRTHPVEDLVSELSQRAEIQYAEPNYIIHEAAVPNDPLFDSLWAFYNHAQAVNGVMGTPGADIKATQAWDITTGSTANVVGVIDSGMNYNHEDLAANVWTAPTSFNVTLGGTTMTCPAGAHGYNAVNNTFDPMDDFGHGTSTAGIVGAVGNNGIGVTGVNWTARVMPCKFLDSSGSGTLEGAINAIEFTIQAKQALGAAANVRVLSNSWVATVFVQSLYDEVSRTNDNNMLFVAAAGNSSANNDTSPFYPANFNLPNVVAVAATDSNDNLASFSNYGAATVHLGAPGVNILSTTIGGYGFGSGTSFAAPEVSGSAALVLALNGGLTTPQLKATILNTVDVLPSLTGRTITGGRLNVGRAVALVSPIRPTNFLTVRGSLQSGGLSDLFFSDNLYASWKPGFVLSSSESPVDVNVTATSPWATPSTLTFTVEARSSVTNVAQKVSMYNYVTNAWEQVDLRPASTSDSAVNVLISTNASRFVNPSDRSMQTRVAYKATGPVLTYPWVIRIDQTAWSVAP